MKLLIRNNVGSGSKGRSSRVNPIFLDTTPSSVVLETQELSSTNVTTIDHVETTLSKNKPKKTMNCLGMNCCYCVQKDSLSSNSAHSKLSQPIWRKWVSCFNYESLENHTDSANKGLNRVDDHQLMEECARKIEALATSSTQQKDSFLSIRCSFLITSLVNFRL